MNVNKSTKKLYIILTAIILVITAIMVILLTDNNTDKVIISSEKNKQLMNTNALTMMYETEVGSGEYQVSTDNTWPQDGYLFNDNLSKCENGGKLTWNDKSKKVTLQTNLSDKCYIYFDKKMSIADVCNSGDNLVSCIKNYYNATGEGYNGLYFHDSNLINGAEDNSYRYSGANPDNYVCFGDDCSNTDNLYRIIGVFEDEIKLIKNERYGNYYWWSGSNSNQSNEWKNSTLNTEVLNETYLSNLGSKWSDMIVYHLWSINGISWENGGTSTAKNTYNYEVGNNNVSIGYSTKIGLMYLSDYFYAASNEYWTSLGYDENYTTEYYQERSKSNWLQLNEPEWTITRNLDTLNYAFILGDGASYFYTVTGIWAIRPTFYINSEVKYMGGNGSKRNPIQINYSESSNIEPTLADVCPNGGNFASCVETYYTTYGEGTGGLYYHDGVGSYTNADQEAGDYSYRYAGAYPNNYVCFGSDATTCPTDNIYRIIGIFNNQVKLIKADYATTSQLGKDGAYYMTIAEEEALGYINNYRGNINKSLIGIYYRSRVSNSTWSTSTLNTVNLNQNYLNNIGSEWSNKIAEHTWQVGGTTTNLFNSPVQIAYNYEVGASAANTTYDAKIGLMYVSDYGYASNPDNWSTNMGSLNSTANTNNNWMYMGLTDWTITRVLDEEEWAPIISLSGALGFSDSYYEYSIRPTFYLNSTVQYISGTGTQSDPFRIA